MKTQFTCSQCGQTKENDSEFTTGYGLDKYNNKVCFACCGINDAKELTELKKGEKVCHYWDEKVISNWPGTLKITPYYITKGSHNIAGKRTDIYFKFNGFNFHAVQYGNSSMIAHIRKTK